MQVHVYLSEPIAAILSTLQELHAHEHPGTKPKPSPIIADAILAYASQRLIRHIKDFGVPERAKAKLLDLAKALDQIDQP
jgi:hypothetical protein